jgi:protein SCO1
VTYSRGRRGALAALAALAVGIAPATAELPAAGQAATVVPRQLQEVGFDQRLGESVPLDAVFRDHTGAQVRLGDLLGERPAILALVYYDCPMLCSLVLQGLTRNLRALSFDAGREFDVIAVSFDPTEGPAEAAGNRQEVLAAYGRTGKASGREGEGSASEREPEGEGGDAPRWRRPSPPAREGEGSASEREPEGEGGDASGWHFLTGAPEAIDQLTSAVGFRYERDEASGEYAHAAGIVIVTPEGKLARYIYGVDFPARDLRLALVEAGDGEIGTVVDQALLFCYRYDPKSGRYSAAILNLVRLGGVVTLLALALFLTLSWRRDARLRRV